MKAIIEKINRNILVPITATFRFVSPNEYNLLNLRRIFKRFIHPFQGEAWLETHNREGQFDPHVHLVTAIEAEMAEAVLNSVADRITAISEGKVEVQYISTVKNWSACRQYIADQSRFRSKSGNEYIFATYSE